MLQTNKLETQKNFRQSEKTQVLNRTLHYSSNDQHILTYLSDVQIKVTFMEALLAVNGHQMVFTKPLEWLVTEGERERARERQRGEGARRISQSQSRVTTNPRHAHCLARAPGVQCSATVLRLSLTEELSCFPPSSIQALGILVLSSYSDMNHGQRYKETNMPYRRLHQLQNVKQRTLTMATVCEKPCKGRRRGAVDWSAAKRGKIGQHYLQLWSRHPSPEAI